MKKIYLVFSLILINNLNAQIKDYEKFIPKSPEISTIGKYIDKPISLSSGSVDFQIPIEEIKVDNNISIPIILKYNTEGIKVNDQATSIGLGWSLSTTSFITRNIRSLPDNYNINLKVDINRITEGLNSNPGSVIFPLLGTFKSIVFI